MSRLQKVHDDIHVVSIPHKMIGLSLGARMIVLRLADRSLAVVSPVPIDDALAAEIAALGEVSHVIAPNVFHHLFVESAKKRYPKAKLHAARGLRKKRPDLVIDEVFDGKTALGDGITPVELRGSMMGETVLVHAPSASVIGVDLVENFVTPPPDLYTRAYLRAAGLSGGVGWSLFLRPVYRDKKLARRSLDELFALPWDRAVIAHGDIVEQGAKVSVQRALDWVR